jgi:hypothetical protein
MLVNTNAISSTSSNISIPKWLKALNYIPAVVVLGTFIYTAIGLSQTEWGSAAIAIPFLIIYAILIGAPFLYDLITLTGSWSNNGRFLSYTLISRCVALTIAELYLIANLAQFDRGSWLITLLVMVGVGLLPLIAVMMNDRTSLTKRPLRMAATVILLADVVTALGMLSITPQ